MFDFAASLSQGHASLITLAPMAILLGALHGLEPGHSKTMMAAFIVAVRGSVAQAALLGLCAAMSHSAVVWAVALGAQALGRSGAPPELEPWLQLISGLIVAAVAIWMFARTRQDIAAAQRHDHGHDHAHDHHHGHDHDHDHDHDHGHDHSAPGYMDDHERAHARDIERRFAGRQVTTAQIAAFGLTGGLIPCPAAITVSILCLQLKQLSLGIGLVLCFSTGLALTMIAAGVIAAIGLSQAQSRLPGFGLWLRRAPYASSALMLLAAAYMALTGWRGLAAL